MNLGLGIGLWVKYGMESGLCLGSDFGVIWSLLSQTASSVCHKAAPSDLHMSRLLHCTIQYKIRLIEADTMQKYRS